MPTYGQGMLPAQSNAPQQYGDQSGGWLQSILSLLMGNPQSTTQMPTVTGQQGDVLSQILQRAMGGQGLGQFDFAPIEQQARTQFQQQTVPSIAERFTSLGGQGSSAFQRSLGQAGAGLEQNLAAMKSQYNMQREPQLQNLLQMGMMPQFENLIRPRQPGMLETGASSLLGGLGKLGGAALGKFF